MALLSTTESDILTASQRGDRSAYGQLVEQYKHLVCAVTYGATGDLHASEDLAQETFVAAWTHLDRLRDNRAFRAWLCGIARNIGLNWLRKRQKDVLAHSESLDKGSQVGDPRLSPRDVAIQREHEAVVWQALEKIPEAFRIPLILYYREGRSVEDVAKMLGMSDVAVRQRLHRGRESLRAQVAELVESSLSRTRPGTGFTAGVLAAIAAIPVGTMAKAGAAVVGAGAAKGWLGMLGSRSLISTSLWGGVIGGVALLVVVVSGWNAKTKSTPTGPSEAAAVVAQEGVSVDAVQSAPAPLSLPPVSEPATASDAGAVLAVATEPSEELERPPAAIVVHPPNTPIREWDDTLKYTGKKGSIAGQILTLDDVPAGGAEVEFSAWRGPRIVIAGRTRANGEGWFTIALPPANYSLKARWQGMAGVDGGCGAPLIADAGDTVFTQVRVEPALAVRGTVVDETSERPLAGVIVATSGGQAVRTDAAGKFQFDAVHRSYDNTIAVVDAAWYGFSHAFAGGTSDVVTLELRARPAGVIHGRVTGPGGTPMKDVPVRLALSGSGFHLSNCLVTTDRYGSYMIAGVDTQHNRLPVRACSDGYRQVDGDVAWAKFSAGARDTIVDLQLRRDPSARYEEDAPVYLGAVAGPLEESEEADEEVTEEVPTAPTEGDWVAGRVVDDEGNPLSCVTVVNNEARSMTNGLGEFRLEGLTSGSRVEVRAVSRGDTGPGGTLAELRTNRDNQHIVVHTPECEVTGRVVDKATGNPIQRFWVKISASNETSPGDFRIYGEEVLVDSEDGSFQLTDLQAKAGVFGRLTVRAHGYSLATVSRVKVHSVGNSGMDESTIELSASPMPGGFTGVVVDKETGLPLRGARISINEANGVADGTFPYSFPFSGWDSTVTNFPGSQHTTTDAQGVFSFPDWADAIGWVAVDCAGYGRYWLHDVAFTQPFRLEMEPEATITGSVFTPKDPNGLGGGISIITMQGDQAIWNECVPINDDGTFSCDRLAPGQYMIHSYGLQIWHKRAVTLTSGSNCQVDL